MFMVMMLHLNFYSIGAPSFEDAHTAPLTSFFRIFFEMFAIIGVNMFVCISGWFSIRPTKIGLVKYLYQCSLILMIVYAAGCMLGVIRPSISMVSECFFFQGRNAWFLPAYLGLYILAPILNRFADNSSREEYLRVLICFYIFQTLYGCLTFSAKFIEAGFSTISFIGLYLLAGYIRRYGSVKLYNSGILLWGGSLFITTTIYWSAVYTDSRILGFLIHTIDCYSSPLNIVGAMGLIMWAANKRPRFSRTVNTIAASSFAVYLVHICTNWAADSFRMVGECIYIGFNTLGYIASALAFMIFVYIISIIIDRVRLFTWNMLKSLF